MTLYPSQASIAPMNTLRLLKTNEVNAPALVVAGSLPIKQLRYDASTDFRVYVLGVVPSGVVFPPLLDRPAGPQSRRGRLPEQHEREAPEPLGPVVLRGPVARLPGLLEVQLVRLQRRSGRLGDT